MRIFIDVCFVLLFAVFFGVSFEKFSGGNVFIGFAGSIFGAIGAWLILSGFDFLRKISGEKGEKDA